MQRGYTHICFSHRLLALIAMMFLFALAAAGQTETTLYTFSGGTDGAWPKAGVTFGPNGRLYGATQYGGADTFGTVYEVSHSSGSWIETVIYSFTDVNDGAGPIGAITFDAAGNIYGTTAFGNRNGTVYELTPNGDGGWSANELYGFSGGSDGGEPLTGVTFDKAGNLYGTTYAGGTGGGVLYKLSPNGNGTWTESVIHAFGSYAGDALDPSTGILIDAAGNLYGASFEGGVNGHGAVYEFSPGFDGSWSEQILYSFMGADDGSAPNALAFDEAGSIFGAAGAAGRGGMPCDYGCGTIFRLTPTSAGSWHFTVIYAFDYTTGETPDGVVVADAGDVYGTTSSGGTGNSGVAFELKHSSAGQGWTYSSLYQFGAGGGGIEPTGLILKDRHLFGTDLSTTTCYLCGTVWEITP